MMTREQMVAALKEERDIIDKAITLLSGGNISGGGKTSKGASTIGTRGGKRMLSAAARKRIGDAARKRWAKVRAAKPNRKPR